jgi:hypothetical protein
MQRIIIALALSCAAFAQDFPCGSVRSTPFGSVCFELPNYEGRARSLNPKTDVPPAPKPRFVPAFVVQPYVESLTTGERFPLFDKFFATRETAEWLAAKFGATVVEREYEGNSLAFRASHKQYFLVWSDGTEINAGQAAIPYTSVDLAIESCESIAAQAIDQWRERLRKYKGVALIHDSRFIKTADVHYCPKCGHLFRRGGEGLLSVSTCTVVHAPGECCHYGEEAIAHGPTLPPHPWIPIAKAA